MALTEKMISTTSLRALATGIIASIACSTTSAHAADSVLIQYQERERTITTENLETFAATGEAVSDDIRIFFEENPEVSTIANDVLTAEIFVSPEFLERFSSSSLGEFVLIQLNKVLGTPSGNEDLEPLRVAIANSFSNDNRFSILEIVRNYPADIIRLDFTGLQPIVNDVKAFVEKVEPALQVAREFLEDIVCDCETTGDVTGSEPAASPSVESEPSEAGSSQLLPTHSESCQSN